MRIRLICVGKLGRSAEAQLTRDYAKSATAAGRMLALGPVEVVEIEPRRPGKGAEGEALLAVLDGAHLIACDEHGSVLPSRVLADKLARLRDDGVRSVAFAIGGAGGLDPVVLATARERMAFGPQTWPHALARVMLAEQLYRSVSILAGSPYHRD